MAFKGMQHDHHEPYWDVIKRIIIESDLVLEILDSRFVELSRNEEVERLINEIGRPVIFVVNKADLVSKDSLKRQVEKLKEQGEVVFLSTKDRSSFKILLANIKNIFEKYGKRDKKPIDRFDPKPKFREATGDIVVGVLGYPNVGKSSIINLLAHKKKVQVSRKAGTTRGIQWIKANDNIKLIDSPGVIPLKKEDELRYGLIGARDADRLKDPEFVADSLIKLFYKTNKNAFEKLYGVELSEDSEKVLEDIARKKSYVLKGNNADLNRAAVFLIRDFQRGQLKF
ncbi:MAG: GTPase [Candidatus Pacearchaeota archaeon]